MSRRPPETCHPLHARPDWARRFVALHGRNMSRRFLFPEDVVERGHRDDAGEHEDGNS